MTISERIEAARRERRVLAPVSRAAWRLEQAERERTWALVSARAEGISIRTLAAAAGLSPSRVHQLVADAGLDGRDHLTGRLPDEVDWLRQCAGWLGQLDGGGYPPTVSLRPSTWRGWPRSSTASPPTWTSSPGPGGSRTWTPQELSGAAAHPARARAGDPRPAGVPGVR